MREFREPDHVTIVKERGDSGGAMVVTVIALLLLAAFAYFMLTRSGPDSTDASVAAAAQKVGDAADKVGNAAEDATKKP